MLQNLSHVLCCAQPDGPVLLQKLQHDVLELLRVLDVVGSLVGEDNACVQNFALQHLLVLVEEGCDAEHHLKDENTDRPPVHRVVVAHPLHHLRCQVLRCPTIALGKVASHLLRESIVNNLDIPFLIDQYVFQLEISMHDALTMQLANR